MHLLHLTSAAAPPALTATSAALANVLIASLWQGVLLTVVVALSLRLLPGLSAAVRSAIWTAVLLLLILLPALPLALPHSGAPNPGILHAEDALSFALVGLWAAASLFRLAQLSSSALRLRDILRRAQPLDASSEVMDVLAATNRRVLLCSSHDVDRPSVAGFVRPRILFPYDLLAELSEAELAQIVLHETEHLRRYDDWINLLQQICLVLFPLNPALVWLNRRLSLERELACDDGVLATTRARKAYAACLARVAENTLIRRSAALVLGLLGTWTRKPELASRVDRILATPAKAMTRAQMRFASGTVLAGILAAASVLAHSPRLVSFGPDASSGAQAESEPVSAPPLSDMGAFRPTLAKAVMPAHGQTLRPAVAPARATLGLHHRRSRLIARRASKRQLAPWVVMTSWQQPATAQAQQTPVPMVRMTTVVFQDSQTWLTAVAVRDGWIVVQL